MEKNYLGRLASVRYVCVILIVLGGGLGGLKASIICNIEFLIDDRSTSLTQKDGVVFLKSTNCTNHTIIKSITSLAQHSQHSQCKIYYFIVFIRLSAMTRVHELFQQSLAATGDIAVCRRTRKLSSSVSFFFNNKRFC